MDNYIGPKIVFKDVPFGGWFCQECQSNIHPDMIHSHTCTKPTKPTLDKENQ